MQIKCVQISHFRSIKALEINLDKHSVILGSNNAGKSTVLKAIDLFFEAAPRLTVLDHYFSDPNTMIEITVTFSNLTASEKEEFGSAVIDGEMVVSRELSVVDKESGIYSVTAMTNPAFDEFRAETNGTKKRGIFGRLAKELSGDLAPASTVDEMQRSLSTWETEHASELKKTKVRGFFGAINVANGKLKKRTSLRLIPAVKETSSEFQDTKKSPILGLLSDIANQIFENRQELSAFIEEAREKARELTDPSGIPQLSNISEALTSAVKRYYSDTEIDANWVADDPLKVIFPTPQVVLSHRGARVSVDYVGHGLQRAVLFAIVQFLAERQTGLSDQDDKKRYDEPLSDIIILIEEPEIYQHPIKQKQIYEAFREISSEFNNSTGIRVQIIYTTHSEKLIDMADFNSVRIIRKSEKDGEVVTTCKSLSLELCSELMAKAAQKEQAMPAAAFAAKLHIFNRDVSEGFFAEKLILVEGATDRAILEGVYKSMGRNPVEEGISIVPMSGKSTLDKPTLIFSKLGIPTYILFDNDTNKPANKKRPETNKLLQRLCGVESPDEWPEGVFDLYAVMPGDLEDYLKSILGARYEELMQQVATSYELSFDDIRKTPAAVSSLFVLANAENVKFDFLTNMIGRVDQLSY